MTRHGIPAWRVLAWLWAIALGFLLLDRSTMGQRTPRAASVGQKSTTGSVLILVNDAAVDPSVLPQLKILVDGAVPAATSIRVLFQEKQIEITDVPAGESRLLAAHRLVEQDEVRILVKPGQQTVYRLQLKPAMVRLKVISEPGSKVSINGRYRAEIPASRKTGNLEFLPGEATLEVVHDEFETKTFTGHFAPGDQELELTLKRIIFSGEFSDGFGDDKRFWNAPATWQVEKGRLKVAGQGTGLLRERIYKDFHARFIVALDNRKGAAWVVRARNESNGYLFQLTGPAGNPPKLLRSFIIQEGKTGSLKSDPVIDDLSRPGSTVEIVVEAVGETIKHFIKPSYNPGEPEPISVLTDKTFSTGTIGFTTLDSEEFCVYLVNVQPKN